MGKTIFVLIDGLGYEQATENLGFPEHLIEQGMGIKGMVTSELPSLSRPLYETLLTGLPVVAHGIVSNLSVQRSVSKSIFDLCRENNLKTAASAYYWVSELYSCAPFDPVQHRIQLNQDGIIQNGIYYFEDFYPDSHVFADAEYLRRKFEPDFLLVHSMNVDDAGHKEGSNSALYYRTAAKLNIVLSSVLPLWLKEGYNVVLTADHGMTEHGLHGGNSPQQRTVPLYIFSGQTKHKTGLFLEDALPQLIIAPLICALLGLEKSPGMQSLSALGVDLFE
jgi:predicted AlkP superfamily pyrophosphatase or phosphodiesterase